MSETVHQEQTTQTAAQPERTFTQAEMDAIIGDRLNRERQKYADYAELKAKALKFDEAENASKTELQKATEKAAALEQELNTLKTQQQVAGIRAKVAQETGVPAALLYGDDEATCKEQAAAILKFAQPAIYPDIRKSKGTRSPVPAGSEAMCELAQQMFGRK